MNRKNAAEPLKSVDPHDGQVLDTYAQHTDPQISSIVDEVLHAQQRWSHRDAYERARPLARLADRLRENQDAWAMLMTAEMGKPIAESEAEILKCAWLCDYYADHAPTFLATAEEATDAKLAQVHFRPLGVVLAIMPWNFPFWQTLRFAAPAIAAGNGVVLKHASNVSGCALALERLFADCLPAGLLRTVLCSSDRMRRLITDERISAVTFTGSTGAGKRVGEAAGSGLKKTVLELGGSDPYLILEDADIETAAEVCAAARLVNSGQSCIAAKRFIVAHRVYDQFHTALCDLMLDVSMGNPRNRGNRIGPLARADLAQRLARQVAKSVTEGARLTSGATAGPDGAYFPATVLGEVRPGMPAADEELFGPVAAVLKAWNETEMIELANHSPFGLGGAVFTSDESKGRRIAADALEVGSAAVNGRVVSDPRLPFGGIKNSGFGRELSRFGILEFVNVKTVVTFDS
ncbi:MAG: NAD-dependent succinate-semialdehyde dehydrogenase [Pseudomonadales bacterium]